MFLLIQKTNFSKRQDRLPLHSNMFLLILNSANAARYASQFFTFQYVSINTGKTAQREWRIDAFTFQYVSINTTHRPHYHLIIFDLYIPICFY